MRVNGLNVVSSKDLPCGNCGTCCNAYGLVDLHVTDLFRISEYLSISPEEFFGRYCIIINDQDGNTAFSMNINGGCVFRANDRCSIYPVRSDTCALYPFNYVCANLSTKIKKEIACYPQCFVHSLDENMLVVPNIERMIDSRILFMVREMYLATFDGRFDEAEAKPFHLKGLSLLKDARMREMVYRKMMTEMMKIIPMKDDTAEPVLSETEIRTICDQFRT